MIHLLPCHGDKLYFPTLRKRKIVFNNTIFFESLKIIRSSKVLTSCERWHSHFFWRTSYIIELRLKYAFDVTLWHYRFLFCDFHKLKRNSHKNWAPNLSSIHERISSFSCIWVSQMTYIWPLFDVVSQSNWSRSCATVYSKVNISP